MFPLTLEQQTSSTTRVVLYNVHSNHCKLLSRSAHHISGQAYCATPSKKNHIRAYQNTISNTPASIIKPEENQPKVSQFFKPLVVLVDSSGDDFLPDLVDPKKKSRVGSKDLSFSPDYTPSYSYKFGCGPYALLSTARVKPTLTSPEMSPVMGVSSNNNNGYILLDTESD